MQLKAGAEPENEATCANFEHSKGAELGCPPLQCRQTRSKISPWLSSHFHTIYFLKNTKRSLGSR